VKSFTTLTTPPSVSTSSASNIATTSARLNGNLSSLGTADNVAVSFEWSTTSGGPYPHETDNQALTESGAFHFDLGSLDPATTYYCRAKARGHGDPVYGDEENFTTLTLPPSVSTDNATNLATTSARLNGNLSSLGTATSVLVCFDWGTSPGGPYPNSTENQTRSTAESFHADLGSLTPGTIYYCRARADGDGDAVYGTEKSFTTLTKPPEVTTMQATGIAPTSATLNGNLDNLGTAASVHVSLEWGLTAGYGNTTTPQTMTDNGTFSANVVGLSVGTTYHYRAKAVGDGDPVYGSDMVFTTPPPPSVTTKTAGQVTTSSAQLNGYLSSLGYASVVTVSFEWGTSSGSYPNETIGENVTSTGTFHFSLSGLIPGTTYYYQARANGGGLPVYGGGSSFTTLAAPTVTTDDAGIRPPLRSL
jgi:phosphodiesterase/alkaline phosphatase D-like protein